MGRHREAVVGRSGDPRGARTAARAQRQRRRVPALALSPDGTTIVTGGPGFDRADVDTAGGNGAGVGRVDDLAVDHSDGSRVVTAGYDSQVRLWKVSAAGEMDRAGTIELPRPLAAATWSSGRRRRGQGAGDEPDVGRPRPVVGRRRSGPGCAGAPITTATRFTWEMRSAGRPDTGDRRRRLQRRAVGRAGSAQPGAAGGAVSPVHGTCAERRVRARRRRPGRVERRR